MASTHKEGRGKSAASKGGTGVGLDGVAESPIPSVTVTTNEVASSPVPEGIEGSSITDSTGMAGARNSGAVTSHPTNEHLPTTAAAAGVQTGGDEEGDRGRPLLVQRVGSRGGGRQQGTLRQSLSFADVAPCPPHLLPSAEWRAYVREAFTNLRYVSG